jgi:hypothetical protein
MLLECGDEIGITKDSRICSTDASFPPGCSLTNQVAASSLDNPIIHKISIPATCLTDFFAKKTEHGVHILSRNFGLAHEDRMPGPRVVFQLVNISDNTRSNWIQVNISYQLKEVFVLIADD